ncbi:hypothetical protein ACJMK2_036986 [Sinanodonta woodiana]|uniref:DNA mismatch repair protein Mlh3 n=1 Tax=Sinanodonta woodiana TaxID=1069815 RepID=A0ABD3WMC5_SINWO
MSCKGVIRQLDTRVRAQLRSGVAITSPAQCVEELLLNALDAGATCVAVRLDFSCFKVQVVDNGKGMSTEDLEVLGERYFTSKCHTVEDLDSLHYFGYRGEAIASMRETCKVLEIVSRTKNSIKTYCKIFHHSKPKPVAESSIPRPSVGTTITAHYLFYNLPVRQKALKETLEIEMIKQRVEGIALMKPDISISLRNDETGQVLLQTQKCQSVLMTFTRLFGTEKSRSLVEVIGSKDYFKISGHIGKESHTKKNIQFVYVNGRLVLKTKIHKLLSETLAKSIIIKKKSNVHSSPAGAQGSPTKHGQRYPMFILNVKCPLSEYDITFEPAKTLVEFKNWEVLSTLVSETVENFLRKENLFIGLKGSLLDENGDDMHAIEGIEDNEADVAANNSIVKEVLSDSIYGSVFEENDNSDNKTKVDEKHVAKMHTFSTESGNDRIMDIYTSKVEEKSSVRNTDEEKIDAAEEDDKKETYGADVNQLRPEAETDYQKNISSFDTKHSLCSRTVKRLNNKQSSYESEKQVAVGLPNSEVSDEHVEKDRENKIGESSQNSLSQGCLDLMEDINNAESSGRELPEATATNVDLPDKMTFEHVTGASSSNTIKADGDDHPHRVDTSTLLNIEPKEQVNSNIRRQKNGIRPRKDTEEEESDSHERQRKPLCTSKLRTKLKSEQIERASESQKRRKSTYRKGLAQFRRHPKSIRNHTKQRPYVDESFNTSQQEQVFRNKSQLKEKYMSDSEEMESRLSLFRKPQGVIGCQKKDKKENNNDEHLPDKGHSFTNHLSFIFHKNQSDLQKKQDTDLKVLDSLTSVEESPIVSGLKLYRKSIQTQNVPARKRSSSLLQVLAEQTHSSKKVQKLTEEDANSRTSTTRRDDKERNVNVKISIEKMQYHNIAAAESSKLTAIDNESQSFGDSVSEGKLVSNHNTVIYSTDHNNVCDIITKSRQHQQENMASHSKVHAKDSRKTSEGPSSELPSTSCKLGKLMRHRQRLKDEKLNSEGCAVVAKVTKSAEHLKPPTYACEIAHTELAITDSANLSNHEILDVSESQPNCVYGDEEYVHSKYREKRPQLLHRPDPVYNFLHPRIPGQSSKETWDCCGTNTYDQSIPFSVDTQCCRTDRSDSEILPFVLYPAPDIVCSDTHVKSDLSSHNNENVMDACTRPYFLSLDSEKSHCRRKTHMMQWSSSANRDVSTDHISLSDLSPNKVSIDCCKRLYLSSSETEVSSMDAHMESFVPSLNTKTVSPYIPMRPYSFAANTNIVNKYAHIGSCCPSFNAANSDLLHSDDPLRLPTSSADTQTLSTCFPKRLDPSSTPMILSSSPSSMEMYDTCISLKSDHLSTGNNYIFNRNPCTMVSNRYFDNASSVPDAKSDKGKYLFQGLLSSTCNDNTTKNQVKITMESSGSENFDSQALAYYPSVTDSESSLTTTQNVVSSVHKISESKDSVSFKSDECSKVTFHTCTSLPDKRVGSECNILCSRSAKNEDFPKQIGSESSISGHYKADCSNDGTFTHGEADYLANEISHDSSISVHLGESFQETEEYIPSSKGFEIHSSPCCDTLEKTLESNISPSQGFRPILNHCKDNTSPGIESQGFSPTLSVHAHNSDSETGSLGFSPNIRDSLIEAAENESYQVTSNPKTHALPGTSSPSSKIGNLVIRRELTEADGKLLKADEIEIESTLTVLDQHSSSTDEIGNSDYFQLKPETSDAKENVETKAEETASVETMTSLDLIQIVKNNDVKANTFLEEQGDAVTFKDIFSSDQSENYITNNKYITQNSSDPMSESVIDSTDVQTCNDKNVSQSPHFSTWDASFEEKIIQSEPALQISCRINDTDDINIWKFDCTNVENHDKLPECTDKEMYSNINKNPATKSNSGGINDCSEIHTRAYTTNEDNENMDKDDEENTWIIVMDPQTGENLHVNTTSGHAIPESQWKRDKHSEMQDGANNDKPLSNINTKWKRPFALSSGDQRLKVQNLLITENVDVQIKWREGAKGINTDAGNSIESLLKDWENPVFQRPDQDVISVESSTQGNKNLIKAYRNIHPCKFTKGMLSCVKVIGQVDNKFIVCLLRADDKNMSADPDMMVLIDQHAAHERVRLEALMQEAYTESDDNKQVMTQSEVFPPHPLTLREEEVRMMMAYRKEFARIGIEFSRDIKTRDTVLIQSIPQCIVEREVNEVKRKRDSVAWDIVETLIKEHVELLQSTRGASGRLPLTLHRVLSSQACHGAIKFGDPLTLDECQALIDSLCHCDLPFQCAHGRPSMMPLLKLQQLRTKIPQQPLRKPKLYVLHQGKKDHQDFN